MEKNAVWILAEQSAGHIKTTGFELLARGRGLADSLGVPLVAVVLGCRLAEQELDLLIRHGADRVMAVEHERLEYFLPEPYTNVLHALVREHAPQILIAAATTEGRTLMPSLAVRCHAGLTADCTALAIEAATGQLVQTRPAIGGNIMASIKSPDHRPQMATVRPHSERPLARDATRTGSILRIAMTDESLLGSGIRRIALHHETGSGAAIQDAEIVVAGGRGCKKAEHFGLIAELASLLDAGLGASRDAVDLGWTGYPHQVGLSGKTISPKLYIAAGISGSIQHLAGIKTSERIVAINTDPEAQIFKIADFGIVGSLHEIIPRLTKRLRELGVEGGRHAEQ